MKTKEQWLGKRYEKRVIMRSKSVMLAEEMHKDDFILRTAGNVPHEDWVPQYDVGRRGCLRLGLHWRGCHLMGLHCYGSRRHAEYLMVGLARLDRRGESGFWAAGAGSERPHPAPGGRP